MPDIYYKLRNGIWIERWRVEEAFYIDHGYYPILGNETEFLVWLHGKLGKSIIASCNGNSPYLIDALIKANQKMLAVKVLCRQWNFSLAKAKEIADEAEAKIKANAN